MLVKQQCAYEILGKAELPEACRGQRGESLAALCEHTPDPGLRVLLSMRLGRVPRGEKRCCDNTSAPVVPEGYVLCISSGFLLEIRRAHLPVRLTAFVVLEIENN